MTRKRVVLHCIILVLTFSSVLSFTVAHNIWSGIYTGMTVSDAQKEYENTYINNLKTVIFQVYAQMNYRNVFGEGKNHKFKDVVLPEKEWLDEGFCWSVTDGKITRKNEGGEENKFYENRAVFDKNGFYFKEEINEKLLNMDRFDSEFEWGGEFVYVDDRGSTWGFDLEDMKKFFEKNNIQIEVKVRKNLSDDTHLGRMKYYVEEKGVTSEEVQKEANLALKWAILTLILVVVSLILFVWLLIIAGHKEKGDKAHTFPIDKLWIDLALAIFCIATIFAIKVLEDLYSEEVVLVIGVIFALIFVESLTQLCESAARRIKCKCLCRTTLMAAIFRGIKHIAVNIYGNLKITGKTILWGCIAAVIFFTDVAFVSVLNGEIIVLFVFVSPIVAGCVLLWVYFKEKEILIEGAEKIAGGQVSYKINEKLKFVSNKKMAQDINHIGDGLEVAVASSLKNERMKTELITNVSHDLKTPLTSIINYIDLLKTDGLDSPKAKTYLDILDRKSQRLKTLTEDLVEASKLNSGVIELQCEKIDIVQLVNQSLAEYEERFADKSLEIVKNFEKEAIYVNADGRKTWRALDNLYSNICKYALSNTRVYIDIEIKGSMAVVSLKNISEGKLNFSGDELMERFVRGEVSRTTEGSGLGLSIAKSIMERQEGSLQIILDGDLFKVQLRLKRVDF